MYAFPVALTHHNIVRTKDRDDVRDEIAARHVVERPEMDERRGADLQTVRFRPAVADDEKAQFPFRRLRGTVGLALGRLDALREDDEAVDQALHVPHHLLPRRGSDL